MASSNTNSENLGGSTQNPSFDDNQSSKTAEELGPGVSGVGKKNLKWQNVASRVATSKSTPPDDKSNKSIKNKKLPFGDNKSTKGNSNKNGQHGSGTSSSSSITTTIKSSMENSDPELVITTLRYPSVKNYRGLRHLIEKCSKSWMEEFLQLDGLGILLEALDTLTSSGTRRTASGQEQNSNNNSNNSIANAVLQLEHVSCIKAVMNSRSGLDYIVQNYDCLRKLTNGLDTKNSAVKKVIFDLLCAVCIYNSRGHILVLEALDNLKTTKRLRFRLSVLIEELKMEDVSPDYKATVLAFINCLILGCEEFNERIKIRRELISIGLRPILQQLRCSFNDEDNICIQCEAFDSHEHSDEYKAEEEDIGQSSNHYKLFDRLYELVESGPHSFHFLSLLQNLIYWEQSKNEEESDRIWKYVTQISSDNLKLNSNAKDIGMLEMKTVSTQTVVTPAVTTKRNFKLPFWTTKFGISSNLAKKEEIQKKSVVPEVTDSSKKELLAAETKKSIELVESESKTEVVQKNNDETDSKLVELNVANSSNAPVTILQSTAEFLTNSTSGDSAQSVASPIVAENPTSALSPNPDGSTPPPPPMPMAPVSSAPPPPPLPGSSIPPPPPPMMAGGSAPPPPPMPGSAPPPPQMMPGGSVPPPPPPMMPGGSVPPPPPPMMPGGSAPPPPPMMPGGSVPPPPPPMDHNGLTPCVEAPIVATKAYMTYANQSPATSFPNTPNVFATLPRPKSKTKRLNWTRVPNQVLNDSIWMDIHKNYSEPTSQLLTSHADEAEQLFCEKKENISTSANSATNGASPPKPKAPSKITLLDSRRSMNIDIFLKQFKMTNEALIELVGNGSSDQIGAERLHGLLEIYPNNGEIELIKSYEDEVDKLASAERFYKLLLHLPFFKLRVEMMLLKEEFNPTKESILQNLELVIATGSCFLKSSSFQGFLGFILSTGNFLNTGSYAGNAPGFKLNTLEKLYDTKANKPRMTLLHFIVEIIEKENPSWLDFPGQDFKNLNEACKYSIEQLGLQITELKSKILRLEKQLGNVSNEQVQSQYSAYIQQLSTIELKYLEDKLSEGKSIEHDVGQFYCEDLNKFKLDEFFKSMHHFCEKLKLVRKENVERKERELRLAAIKAKEKDKVVVGKTTMTVMSPDGTIIKTTTKSNSLSVHNNNNNEKCVVDMLLDDIRKGSFKLRKTQSGRG